VRKYFVVFRACDVVQSLHGAPRPFGLSKGELIRICFASLHESLQDVPHEIHVIGDRISEPLQAFFRERGAAVTVGTYGNDASIRASFELGMTRPDGDWVYVVEDDYLHQPHALAFIDDFIAHRADIMQDRPLRMQRRSLWYENLFVRGLAQRPLFIHPPDYPDRYLPEKRRFSMVFQSSRCHWRQVGNTTFTLMAEASTLRRFRGPILEASSGARDGYMSRKLYGNLLFAGRGLCVSPIPGLATHMHESTMTPLVDWAALVERQRKRLGSALTH
jgi:hypothetical protein